MHLALPPARRRVLLAALAPLLALSPADVYVVGGEGVVSEAVASALADDGRRRVHRVAGADRHETAAELALGWTTGTRSRRRR